MPFTRRTLLLLAAACAGASAASIPWDMGRLSRPPKASDAPGFEETGVRALFFEGEPYHGKPTRVFAFYGAPQHKPGEKLPAMVLVHGGGGTAFAEWVRMWNNRGYAAIAMDTCGAAARHVEGKPWAPEKVRQPDGGPPGWGGFDQIDAPVTDQWTYHAVSAVILAHSLLRSFPEVDGKRIGLTGISWGGYLTDIVAGVDNRFRFAAPVYGCGFLGEDSAWLPDFEKMGRERASKWLGLWDPSHYLPNARMPMLWVTGTNDFAYPMPSLQKSYRLPRGRRTLAIRVRMLHDHPHGAEPEEIRTVADALLRRGKGLARLTGQGSRDGSAWVTYSSPVTIVKADLKYTKSANGPWKDREWQSVPAQLDTAAHRASAVLPDGVTAYYLNLLDDRGLVVSSEHVTRVPAASVAGH